MLNRVQLFFKEEFFKYTLIGSGTMLINVSSFLFLRSNCVGIGFSNTIAFLLSVIFSFYGNNCYVFGINKKPCTSWFGRFIKFFGLRVASFVIEMILLYILIDQYMMNEIACKLGTNVIVIILNYIFSKYHIFKE